MSDRHTTEKDAPNTDDGTHCIVCGLRLSTASEWCMETRDGDHRPTLPTGPLSPGSDQSS